MWTKRKNNSGSLADSDNNWRDRPSQPLSDVQKLVEEGMRDLFNKCKTLNTHRYINPILVESLPQSPLYFQFSLEKKKQQLEEVKGKLDGQEIKQWKQHTSRTNMTGAIIADLQKGNDIGMCTNAWLKMFEIVNRYPLIRSQCISTLHLCEAPGAFVCAVDYYYKNRYFYHPNLNWVANTLNETHLSDPQYDARFVKATIGHWDFCEDGSGDIMNADNIIGMWRDHPDMDLVTADGSINIGDNYAEQETMTNPLHFAEVVCALGTLKVGGGFVLKMFNILTNASISIVALLCGVFKKVDLFKPGTSRAPNAEIYVVCVDFQGISYEVLNILLGHVKNKNTFVMDLNAVPKSIIDSIVEASCYFADKQMQAINRNLQLKMEWNRNVDRINHNLRQRVVGIYRDIYALPYGQRIRHLTTIY